VTVIEGNVRDEGIVCREKHRADEGGVAGGGRTRILKEAETESEARVRGG